MTFVGTSAAEWIVKYSAELGVDAPTQTEIDNVLLLAGIAARSSERTAAPVACWLAGRAGLELGKAQDLAKKASPPAAASDQPSP